MLARFSATVRLPEPPLRQLDLNRLSAHQPLERGDPRFVGRQELGRGQVLIERAGLRLLDPDPDQIARQVMPPAEGVKRLLGVVLGDDLALEVGAVIPVSKYELASSESPPPVNRLRLGPSSPRGALHPLTIGRASGFRTARCAWSA
jgi:hypothetical protein